MHAMCGSIRLYLKLKPSSCNPVMLLCWLAVICQSLLLRAINTLSHSNENASIILSSRSIPCYVAVIAASVPQRWPADYTSPWRADQELWHTELGRHWPSSFRQSCPRVRTIRMTKYVVHST